MRSWIIPFPSPGLNSLLNSEDEGLPDWKSQFGGCGPSSRMVTNLTHDSFLSKPKLMNVLRVTRGITRERISISLPFSFLTTLLTKSGSLWLPTDVHSVFLSLQEVDAGTNCRNPHSGGRDAPESNKWLTK